MATVRHDLQHTGRSGRPLVGGIVLILAGIWIGLVNWWMGAVLIPIKPFAGVGMLFGGVIAITGILLVARPGLSRPLGVIAVTLSVLALLGSLGGLFFGTLLGIAGGSLAIAWEPAGAAQQKPEPESVSEPSSTATESIPSDETEAEGVNFSWQETTQTEPTSSTDVSSTSFEPSESGEGSSFAWQEEEAMEGTDEEKTAEEKETTETSESGDGPSFAWQEEPDAEGKSRSH